MKKKTHIQFLTQKVVDKPGVSARVQEVKAQLSSSLLTRSTSEDEPVWNARSHDSVSSQYAYVCMCLRLSVHLFV